MATNLTVRVNNGDASIPYGSSGATFVDMDLTNDYLIWSAGSTAVADGQDEPTPDELNNASTIITDEDVTVAHCLLYDYSEGLLDEVEGMGGNYRYSFCFSFDGATASEPQLEAWDDENHNSTDKHVLGGISGYDSFVKGACTTAGAPGAGWAGSAMAGSSDILLLNNGSGALDSLDSGETSQELYANLKIVIPADYPTPAVEEFVFTVRYTWN